MILYSHLLVDDKEFNISKEENVICEVTFFSLWNWAWLTKDGVLIMYLACFLKRFIISINTFRLVLQDQCVRKY